MTARAARLAGAPCPLEWGVSANLARLLYPRGRPAWPGSPRTARRTKSRPTYVTPAGRPAPTWVTPAGAADPPGAAGLTPAGPADPQGAVSRDEGGEPRWGGCRPPVSRC